MGSEVLHVGCEVKEFILIALVRMDCSNGKLSVSECACLVEHNCTYLRQHIHIVGSLHEDTLTRCASDTSEERQRHTYHESTRTRYHEEHQGTIEPGGEGTTQQSGYNR